MSTKLTTPGRSRLGAAGGPPATGAPAPPETAARDAVGRRALWLTALLFLLSRAIYLHGLGVQFDVDSLQNFVQFIDPELLRTRLLESLWHLRDQPPLFNLLVGAALQLAPQHYAGVLHGIYLAAGLTLTLWLVRLGRLLGLPTAAAVALALFFAVNPATVLYENWLFYEYPLALCLSGATLMLGRFLLLGVWRAALMLFSLCGAIVLLRGTFHPLWLLMIVGATWLAARRRAAIDHAADVTRRAPSPFGAWRVLLAAAPAFALVALFYAKHAWLTGDWITGRTFQQLNRAIMITFITPEAERLRLVREGRVSRLVLMPIYNRPLAHYRELVPPPPPTGIPLRDTWRKSTGYPNWHADYMLALARAYEREADVLAPLYPDNYWKAVGYSYRRYFLPTGDAYPFNLFWHDNGHRLRPWLQAWQRWLLATDPPRRRTSPVLFRFLPLLAGALAVRVVWGALCCRGLGGAALRLDAAPAPPPQRRMRTTDGAGRSARENQPRAGVSHAPERAAESQARGAQEWTRTILHLFILCNLLYVSIPSILLSHDDQNRYRFCLLPLLTVAAAALAGDALRALARGWRQLLSIAKSS